MKMRWILWGEIWCMVVIASCFISMLVLFATAYVSDTPNKIGTFNINGHGEADIEAVMLGSAVILSPLLLVRRLKVFLFNN